MYHFLTLRTSSPTLNSLPPSPYNLAILPSLPLSFPSSLPISFMLPYGQVPSTVHVSALDSQLPPAVLSLIATVKTTEWSSQSIHSSECVRGKACQQGCSSACLVARVLFAGPHVALGRRPSLQQFLARDMYTVRGGLQPFSPARLISRQEPAGLEGSLRVLRAGEASLPQPLLSVYIWRRPWPGANPPPQRIESTVLVVCPLPSVLVSAPKENQPPTHKLQKAASPNVQK